MKSHSITDKDVNGIITERLSSCTQVFFTHLLWIPRQLPTRVSGHHMHVVLGSRQVKDCLVSNSTFVFFSFILSMYMRENVKMAFHIRKLQYYNKPVDICVQ